MKSFGGQTKYIMGDVQMANQVRFRCIQEIISLCIMFSHDATADISVFQTNEKAAMLVFQTNPVGVEIFSFVNAFSCFNKFA